MSAVDFTFLLKPRQKFRYNAGPYDRERQMPAYTIEISAPSQVRTADGFSWVWDIENRSDSALPPLFTVKKDGQPVPRLEHMARL